jgi:hypothetical protein
MFIFVAGKFSAIYNFILAILERKDLPLPIQQKLHEDINSNKKVIVVDVPLSM